MKTNHCPNTQSKDISKIDEKCTGCAPNNTQIIQNELLSGANISKQIAKIQEEEKKSFQARKIRKTKEELACRFDEMFANISLHEASSKGARAKNRPCISTQSLNKNATNIKAVPMLDKNIADNKASRILEKNKTNSKNAKASSQNMPLQMLDTSKIGLQDKITQDFHTLFDLAWDDSIEKKSHPKRALSVLACTLIVGLGAQNACAQGLFAQRFASLQQEYELSGSPDLPDVPPSKTDAKDALDENLPSLNPNLTNSVDNQQNTTVLDPDNTSDTHASEPDGTNPNLETPSTPSVPETPNKEVFGEESTQGNADSSKENAEIKGDKEANTQANKDLQEEANKEANKENPLDKEEESNKQSLNKEKEEKDKKERAGLKIIIPIKVPPKIQHIIDALPHKVTLYNNIPWMAIMKKDQLMVNEGALSPGSLNYDKLPLPIPYHIDLPRKREEVILVTPAAIVDPTGGLDITDKKNVRFVHTAKVINKGLMENTGQVAAKSNRIKTLTLVLVGNAVDADVEANLGGIYSQVELLSGGHRMRTIRLVNSGKVISGTLGYNMGLIHGKGIVINRPDRPDPKQDPSNFKGVLSSVKANYGLIKDILNINTMGLNAGYSQVDSVNQETVPANEGFANFGHMKNYTPYYTDAGKKTRFYNFGLVDDSVNYSNKDNKHLHLVPEKLKDGYNINGVNVLVNRDKEFDPKVLADGEKKVVNKLSLSKDLSINNAAVNAISSSTDTNLGTLSINNSVINASTDYKSKALHITNSVINAPLTTSGVKSKLDINHSVINAGFSQNQNDTKTINIKDSFINDEMTFKNSKTQGTLNLQGETYVNADINVGNMIVNIDPSVRLNSMIKDAGTKDSQINLGDPKDLRDEISIDPSFLLNIEQLNIYGRVHYTARSMFDKTKLTKGATKRTTIENNAVLRVDINPFAKIGGNIMIPLNTQEIEAKGNGILYLSNPGKVFDKLFPNKGMPWLKAGDTLKAAFTDNTRSVQEAKLIGFSDKNLGIDDAALQWKYDGGNQLISLEACPNIGGCTVQLPVVPPPAPPAPQPAPQPSPKPVPPAPKPVPPAPAPKPDAKPQPTPQPAPMPNPVPAPQPAPQPAPKPVPAPVPAPAPQPAPQPAPAPAPKPSFAKSLAYTKLNAVYKSAVSANMLVAFAPTTTTSNKSYEDAIKGLLSLMDGFYANSPYAYSIKANRDSLDLFAASGVSSKANEGKWSIESKLLIQGNRSDDAAYGESLYGYDVGKRSYKTRTSLYGGLLAMERGLSDSFGLGYALGAAHQKADFASGGKLKANSLYVGLYARKSFDSLSFYAGVGYQRAQMNAKRKISNDYQLLQGRAKYHSNALNAYLQGSYKLDLGAGLSLQPLIRTSYNYISQGKIGENESKTPLSVSKTNQGFWDVKAGTKLAYELGIGSAKLQTSLGMYAKHSTSKSKDLSASFDGGSLFAIKGANIPKTSGQVEYELAYESTGGVISALALGYEFGNNGNKNTNIRLNIGYKF